MPCLGPLQRVRVWGPLNSLTDETTTQLGETDTHPDQSQFEQVVSKQAIRTSSLAEHFLEKSD